MVRQGFGQARIQIRAAFHKRAVLHSTWLANRCCNRI
jgi:hypothetical protein